jgi:hypothetical protein
MIIDAPTKTATVQQATMTRRILDCFVMRPLDLPWDSSARSTCIVMGLPHCRSVRYGLASATTQYLTAGLGQLFAHVHVAKMEFH